MLILTFSKDDPAKAEHVIVDVDVDKKEKTKIRKIIVHGNDNLAALKIDKAMKKPTTTRYRMFSVLKNSSAKNTKKTKFRL